MLYLGFQFYNAKGVVKNGQTYIAATDPAQPTYMIVIFPSQHLGEEVFVDYNGDANFYPNPPLHGALAGFSWLTFLVPPHASIPFTAAGLLNWAGLTPRLVVNDPTFTVPGKPDPLHSALEVPCGRRSGRSAAMARCGRCLRLLHADHLVLPAPRAGGRDDPISYRPCRGRGRHAHPVRDSTVASRIAGNCETARRRRAPAGRRGVVSVVTALPRPQPVGARAG